MTGNFVENTSRDDAMEKLNCLPVNDLQGSAINGQFES
jgi:hypothetical protein